MTYPWLRFGHLLGVVLFVTGWGIYIASVDGYRRAQTVGQLQTFASLTAIGERVLAAGGLLLLGFGVTLTVKFYSFSATWIVAALGLVVVQGVSGAARVAPRAHGLRAALATAPEGPVPAALAAIARDRVLHVANRASIPLLFDIEFVMTVKPAAGDIAISLVVVAAALALSWPVLIDRSRRAPPLASPGGREDGPPVSSRLRRAVRYDTRMTVSRAILLFALAGLAEIGGGYLVWRWLREGAAPWVGVVGGVVLILYGVIPTLQDENRFGRVYAAYGGVFVLLSLLWGWWLDGHRPDRYDVLGAIVVSVGVGIILFAPRPPP